MSTSSTIVTRPAVVQLPPLPATPEDCVRWAAQVQKALYDQLVALTSLAGGNLRWQNLKSYLTPAPVAVAGPAPAIFSVTHNLGKVPEAFIPMLDVAGSVYATAPNRAAWTTSTIQLTVSAAPCNVTLLVL